MEEVNTFLHNLFELEVEVIKASRGTDLADYNKKAQQLKSFGVNETIGLGHPILDSLDNEFFEEYMMDLPQPEKRHLFKITEYLNQDENIYKSLVSVSNPLNIPVTSIAESYVIKKIKGKMVLVAKFFFSTADNPEGVWHFSGGEKKYKMDDLGKIVAIKRIKPPLMHESSIKEYEKES